MSSPTQRLGRKLCPDCPLGPGTAKRRRAEPLERRPVLLSRGEPTSTALLLVKGPLRVSVPTPEGEEQLLRWMLPGEISGLSSVFAETTYPADLVSAVPDGVMLRVSQTDLAQAASASRQRVNQQLRHFQAQGLTRLGYRNIVLLRQKVQVD